MLSALYGISRLGSEVTHPRLHGELVAEVMTVQTLRLLITLRNLFQTSDCGNQIITG